MNTKPLTLLAAVVGFFLGGLVVSLVLNNEGDGGSNIKIDKKEPLYWVAPMDANFRSAKPGKSPMGMDLIPVYKDDMSASSVSPGTVTIDPRVVNNLGVRTVKVERKALHQKILSVGYVKYDENKLIHIHPRVSGWIDKLFVKAVGEPVKKGEALYSLYSPELVNAQEEFIHVLQRKDLRLIKAVEDRMKALHIPASFIQNLKRTKAIKQSITFYSPQEGVIDNLKIRQGFYVQPGNTLFSIGALDSVWVEAEVLERQAPLIKQGAKVSMQLDYIPGETWEGRVDYIYPVLDSKTRALRLRLRFDNPDKKLLPNMFAQVVIDSQSDENLLLIPQETLIRTGEQQRVVLALDEGKFKSIAVTTGREDQDSVEVISGLMEGDKIVSSAQFLLDSESSKTSDFKRMNPEVQADNSMPESVWVAAEIETQQHDERVVTVSHQAIEAWNMAAMTMKFTVAEDVDFKALTPGTQLHMEIRRGDSGMIEIIGTHIMRAGEHSSDISKMGEQLNNHSETNKVKD